MRRGAILLLTIALATAACGGDDSSTSEVDDLVEAPAGATTDDGDTDEAAGDTGGPATAGSIGADACREAAEALSAVPQSLGLVLSGQGDASEVRDQAAAIADLDVPDDLRADFQLVADTFAEIAEALDGVDLSGGSVPDAQTQAQLSQLTASLSDNDYQTASTNLSQYFSGGCQ